MTTTQDGWDDLAPGWPDDPADGLDVPPQQASASWTPVDMAGYLDGSYQPPRPALLPRSDGQCLLYPGLTHSFHGESESGKSLVAQYLAACLVNEGRRVLYVDYESDPGAVGERLVMFGARLDAIRAGLVYVRPEQGPHTPAERYAWHWLNGQRFALAVLDGVTASLVQSGHESKDNDGVTAWSMQVPEHLARHTGAAVVMIDHVPKDAATRGRFAIGAQAKLGRITGAAYSLEPKQALGVGLRGIVELRLVKDRPGQLRQHTGSVRWSDRSAPVASFVLDSTTVPPTVTLRPPDSPAEDRPFRPTAVMENLSRYLEKCDGPRSKSQIEQNVPHKAAVTRQALELLVSGGWITTHPGARNALLHASAMPYRQADDPESDVYSGQSSVPPETA